VSFRETASFVLKLGQSEMLLENLPAVPRRRRKAFGSPPPSSGAWVLVVEAGEEVVAVDEVAAGLPAGLGTAVPLDEVGKRLLPHAALQKFLDVPLDVSVAAVVEAQGIQELNGSIHGRRLGSLRAKYLGMWALRQA